jgi:predicted amidohydrolase YtcJ
MRSEQADVLLHGGSVAGHPDSDAVAVANGRIIAYGRYDAVKSHIGPRTRMVPLGGRVLMPGFIDCHQHFMEGAAVASGLSVVRCRSLGDLLAELRVASAKTPPGNWLRAFGCDEALIREGRGPTREELDQAVPKNPLRLRHQTLHASWLNSRAILALGLESPNIVLPQGAQLVRDSVGRLTGLVVGMERWLSDRLPKVTAAELEARARIYSQELAANGITAFTDATVRNGAEEIAAFARLTASRAIKQRVCLMIGAEHLGQFSRLQQQAAAESLHLLGVKFTDVTQWEPARLARAIVEALRLGADCAFHVTEIEELDAVLRACQTAWPHLSHPVASAIRIEHGGVIPPDYAIQIAALGAWVVTNPGFIYYRGAKYVREPGLLPYLYRGQSLLQAGIKLAAGTDAPVTPAKPLHAVAAAATRVSLEGYNLAPDEKLATDCAFSLFTSRAAELSRLSAGEIMIGRLADFAVLPADPLQMVPTELMNLSVDATIVGGQLIYEKGRPPIAQSAGLPLFTS